MQVGDAYDSTETRANQSGSVSYSLLDYWYDYCARNHSHATHAEKEACLKDFINREARFYTNIAGLLDHQLPGAGGAEIETLTVRNFSTFKSQMGWSQVYNTYLKNGKYNQQTGVNGFNRAGYNITANDRLVVTATFKGVSGELHWLIECFNFLTEKQTIINVPQKPQPPTAVTPPPETTNPSLPPTPPTEPGTGTDPKTQTWNVYADALDANGAKVTGTTRQGPVTVDAGSSTTFTIPSVTGYEFKGIELWTYDGQTKLGTGSANGSVYSITPTQHTKVVFRYASTNVGRDMKVYADHLLADGTTVPGTSRQEATVKGGQQHTFTVTIPNGYELTGVEHWSYDGTSRKEGGGGPQMVTGGRYTFTVNDNQRVIFRLKKSEAAEFTVTLVQQYAVEGNSNWSIWETKQITVKKGGSVTIPASIFRDCTLYNVDGANVARGVAYTVSNITSNRTINAYYLSPKDDENYTIEISPAEPGEYKVPGNDHVTVVPEDGGNRRTGDIDGDGTEDTIPAPPYVPAPVLPAPPPGIDDTITQ
jgi:hypothetical protein